MEEMKKSTDVKQNSSRIIRFTSVYHLRIGNNHRNLNGLNGFQIKFRISSDDNLSKLSSLIFKL